MTRWARAFAGAVLCVVVLVGCTSLTRVVDASTSTGFHLAQIEHAMPSQPSSVAIERVTRPPSNEYDWTVGSVDPASDRVEVSWTDGGDLRCGEVDRLQVNETDDAVTIGVAATHRDPELACTLEGHLRTTTVHLGHALGGRALMEGSTGVNDGLPKVSNPSLLPDPTCSTEDGSASDVPVGMPDVPTRMAPTAATKVFVCRTWWPKGSVHAESTTITDAATVRALVAAVNHESGGLPAGSPNSRCDGKDVDASLWDLYFQGRHVRVEVKTNAISCDTITNGAVSGTMTPALLRTLDALFSS